MSLEGAEVDVDDEADAEDAGDDDDGDDDETRPSAAWCN